MLAFTSSLSAKDLAEMGLKQNPDLSQIALASLVVDPLVSTCLALAQFALVFASAKVLGGKGTYVKQANSMSLVLCGSSTILLALVLPGVSHFHANLHPEGLGIPWDDCFDYHCICKYPGSPIVPGSPPLFDIRALPRGEKSARPFLLARGRSDCDYHWGHCAPVYCARYDIGLRKSVFTFLLEKHAEK